jgi:hypothetical protein
MKTLIIILALALTGCSALEQKFERPPYTLCDENESLLICDSAELTNCVGYLEDKSITTLEETEL